ncbi:MAG: TonB-dependent receptor [Alphaproteobacteria bacterium]|nr:MAG: TonB-dependent receptor [Alphaproteobacteria bacterium]
MKPEIKRVFVSSTMLASLGALAMPATAQDTATDTEATVQLEEIVVTGSRIKRSQADTSAPQLTVDESTFKDRGYVSAADALNQLTSITPQLNQAAGDGSSSGSGQQFPNLFGLGTGRTLTLVNGRRMVTSSSGLGDAQVDANIIPVGLLERVEVVQAGGAAVYGSDAIAGVVNYILKKDFEGIELDGQASISDYGDYPVYNLRGTFGKNFADGRGNIALNVEWSKTDTLAFADRPRSNLSRITQGNADDTGPDDGIPAVREILDAHFWNFNSNGIVYTIPAPLPNFLAMQDGHAIQFDSNGNVVAYNPGEILGIPFAQGGEGFRYSDLAGLRTGVERFTANMIGHYDINDNVVLSTEFLFARTEGTETPQGQSRTVLNSAASGAGPIMFTINNPFLTDQAKEALTAISPGFGFGAPMWLSKYFYDLVPDNQQVSKTDTYRGMIALDGDFSAGGRDFYWSVAGSYGRVEGQQRRWEVINSAYNNAINATLDGSGNIVCAINADADSTNDDASCAPINPFGNGNVSDAARDYVATEAGLDYVNDQLDFVASFGGGLFDLPAGEVKFSTAYEHRYEKASFVPMEANQLGLFGTGTMEVPQSGKYNTDEFSAELLIPLLGADVTLPLVKELELSTAYRFVDNSTAGTENVWNVGLRWVPVDGLTLRASRSRNFRAPTLTQLYAPSTTSLDAVGYDPCDADRIDGGPNPAVRRANCQALFAANPSWGDLADFQDPAENFTVANVTTGGNADLRNEVSDTLTFGLVLQPVAIPGLTIAVDRVEIDLKDGLVAFDTQNFMEACYDSVEQPADVCGAFSRLAADDGTYPGGTVVTGRITTFNAGVMKYRGEVYHVNYVFDLPGEAGTLDLGVEATHNSLFTTSVTGTTFTNYENTATMPDWVGRFDAKYINGPLRVTYQLYYLDDVLAAPDATIESTPNPVLESNTTHSISGTYDFGSFVVRAGVSNFTNKQPSYPSLSYGDIIGRQFWAGATVKF